MDVLGCNKTTTNYNKTGNERAPDEPPEGSWWMKVPLGCALVAPSNRNSGFHSNSGRNPNLGLEQGHPVGTGYCLFSIGFFLQIHLEEPKIHACGTLLNKSTKNPQLHSLPIS